MSKDMHIVRLGARLKLTTRWGCSTTAETARSVSATVRFTTPAT